MRAKIIRLLGPSGNAAAADDVCQEFWLLLWKVGPAYWNPKGVNLISKQVAFKWLRKHKAPALVPVVDRIDDNPQEPTYQHSEIAPDVTKIRRFLKRLPGEQLAVFSFRYQIEDHEELTFNEIGQRMGISTSQAAHLFYQARKNLKILLRGGL